jgi:hypothetical protein
MKSTDFIPLTKVQGLKVQGMKPKDFIPLTKVQGL